MGTMRRILQALAIVGFGWMLMGWQVHAQAPGAGDGTTRIQGQPVDDTGLGPAVDLRPLVDFREEMRKLVRQISAYARRINPNFIVIPHNGLALLEKQDPVDDKKVFQSRSYMVALDAILQDGMLFGDEAFGTPTLKERRDEFKRLAAIAKENRIPILAMDFATEPETIDLARNLARKEGWVSYVAPAFPTRVNELSKWPRRPFDENPKHILSFGDVKNFAYLSDSARYGRQAEFALEMHDNNYDMLVVDVFHARKPLSKQAVETLKYKKLGSRRLVLARMHISTVANYDFFWRAEWQPGSPLWITAPYPTDPDRFFVEYWQPEWQQVLMGNPQSYLFGILAQGFDGVVIDGIEAYRFFESDGEDIQGFR